MAKIFLIEDDATMQMLLKTLLELEGHEVVIWKGGQDPVSVLSEVLPEVAIIDVNLRGARGDGFAILKALRADPQFLHLHVIMSSGMDYREKSIQAGANQFIMKPYMPDVLMNMIKQAAGDSQHEP